MNEKRNCGSTAYMQRLVQISKQKIVLKVEIMFETSKHNT
jgi:hypothetical protein